MTGDRQEPDHDTLLKLYGEAMLRIAQLEARLAATTDHPPESPDRGLRDIGEKVDALRNLIVESNGTNKPRSYPPPAQVGADAAQPTEDSARPRTRTHDRRSRRSRKEPEAGWLKRLADRLVR